MSIYLWIALIVIGVLIILYLIGRKEQMKQGKPKTESKPSTPIQSQSQAPSRAFVIDESMVIEIRQLLNVVDQEARISSSPKSEKWKNCDARLKEIGEGLFNEGGEDLMKFVFDMVYQDKSLRGHYLNDAWDRVGTWWA
jgi:hypothetical protein